jgi:endonuclease/exonuclease/phosphatase (EEP) superfamily protein YafD
VTDAGGIQHSPMKWLNRVISLLALVAIVAIALIAHLTSRYGWAIYLELLSHFQVQYFVIALVLLGILLLLRRHWFAFVGIVLCAMLSLQVFTWYLSLHRIFPIQGTEAHLRVLIANINTQNKSYGKVLNLVRSEQPDVAIFMEVDEVWKAQLDILKDLLPYSSGQSNPYNLGLLVYSNQLLNDSKLEFFGSDRNPSVVAQLTVADQPVTLLATHPLPPVKPSFFQSRNQQLAFISQYLAGVNNRVILAGDLNTTMWSPYYRRLVNQTGLSNARKGFGILPTWPTKGTYHQIPPWLTSLLRIPIDHCLISRGLITTSIHTGSDTGSDHKPLVVDLRVTPNR